MPLYYDSLVSQPCPCNGKRHAKFGRYHSTLENMAEEEIHKNDDNAAGRVTDNYKTEKKDVYYIYIHVKKERRARCGVTITLWYNIYRHAKLDNERRKVTVTEGIC